MWRCLFLHDWTRWEEYVEEVTKVKYSVKNPRVVDERKVQEPRQRRKCYRCGTHQQQKISGAI